MNIFLSCTKKKANHRCRAEEMYGESPLFQKSLEYAKSLNPDKLYILSAKHHVVSLSKEIEPYNYTLKDCSAEERKEWTEEVVKQLKSRGVNFEAKTLFFCGEDYIQYLKEYFPNHKSMFDSKQIGEILHYLDTKLDKKTNESLYEYLIYNLNDSVENYII
jgi:hypothetical protein